MTGVTISVTITNNMFTIVRYVMFELSLLYINERDLDVWVSL